MKKSTYYLFYIFFSHNLLSASSTILTPTKEDSHHLNSSSISSTSTIPVPSVPPSSVPADMYDILESIPRENSSFTFWQPGQRITERYDAYRDGQYALGLYYAKDYFDILPSNICKRPKPITLNKAQDFFYIAAILGKREAQYFLGLSFLSTNVQLALRILTCLSSLEYAPAQFSLGQINYHGSYVPKDYEKSLRFMQLASDLRPDENILDKQARIISLYYQGRFFSKGQGISQNYEKAYNFFHQAGTEGCMEAQYELGIFYQRGIHVPRNLPESYSWFEKSSKKKYLPALYEIAECYYKGHGVRKNAYEGFKIFVNLSQQGYAPSIHRLGVIHLIGEEVAINAAVGLDFIERAASEGYAPAQFNLYEIYMGNSDFSSKAKGMAYLRQAAAQNYGPAVDIVRIS